MAKQTKAAAPAAKAKSSSKTWLIAVVAVIVVLLLIVWGKKGAEAPAPTPGPEVAPAPEAAPTGEEAAPAVTEGAEGTKQRVLGPPGNAEVVTQTITWKSAGGQPVTKEEGTSMFSGISCQHAQKPEGESTTEKEDTLSFTFTNKGKNTYHLYYVKYGTEGYETALRMSVNGRRVRDVEKACGQNDVAPGETVTCNGAAVLLRSGQTYTGKELVNSLQAQAQEFVDNLVFKC
ncbi:hypothetical protein HY488_01300 [Candidatus Woesearchaeota archaeon]|nr:hypothetical protein [Candidatus Woesearchaeota archaeon]